MKRINININALHTVILIWEEKNLFKFHNIHSNLEMRKFFPNT